jgi:hypothetical protein
MRMEECLKVFDLFYDISVDKLIAKLLIIAISFKGCPCQHAWETRGWEILLLHFGCLPV